MNNVADRLHYTTKLEQITCPKCGNSYNGCFKVYRDGYKEPTAKVCDECRQKEEIEKRTQENLQLLQESIKEQREYYFECSNIEPKFGYASFENFEKTFQPIAFKVVKEYFDKKLYEWNEDCDRAPKSLILYSPALYGLGKTHLVSALANSIINNSEAAFIDKYGWIQKRKHCPVYFTTEMYLMDHIRATFNVKRKSDEFDDENKLDTEEKIYKDLFSYELLIIDDVGKIKPRDLSFLQGVYFRVIDHCYTNENPLILTTNLDLDQLEAYIGGACADRLREMCGKNIVKMTGKSYRAVKGDK